MTGTKTITASEFKAAYLHLLDSVGAGEWGRVGVTKRGRVVAVLVPPSEPAEAVGELHGFMRGLALIPVGLDLTAPTTK